jgi:hypothetical protein
MFAIFLSDLTIDKSSDNSNQNSQNNYIHGMTILHDQFPILFEIFSDEGEKRVPEPCADDGIDDEFGQIHFPHSGRKRDKMPHNWDKSTDQNCDASFFLEKMLSRRKLFFIQ